MVEEKVVVTPGLVVAETANALKVVLPTALPCPTEDIFSIPSVEDLLKPLLEIAQLPDKLDAKLALMKKEKEEEIVLLVKKLQNPDLTAEERAAILEEIRIAEDYVDNVIMGELFEQFRDIKKSIEKYFDKLQKLLSPYWKETEGKKNLQQELMDAIDELVADFHMYIPNKVSELIGKIVPLSLTINILGLSIDIVKLVTTPSYRNEITDQIAGKNFVTQIISKRKRLAEINKELMNAKNMTVEEIEALEKQKEQLEEEILALEEKRAAWVDKFFSLVPDAIKKFDGKLSELNEDRKAKLTWDYIKTEIKEWVTNAHIKALEKLIDLFDEIWDLLGLPDLPITSIQKLLTMDIPALIEKVKASLKRKFQTTASELREKIAEIDKKLETETDPATIDKLNEEKRELEQKLLDEKGKYLRQLEEAVLGFEIPIIGMTIEQIIGKDTRTNSSIEERLQRFEERLEDFKQNWQQKLLFTWVKLIKKFLQAIGLGKLIDMILLTMCDFLNLIGNPFAAMIVIPNLDGVIDSTTYKPTVRVANKTDSSLDSTLKASDGTALGNSFPIDGTSGDLYVFVNGVRQVEGSADDEFSVVGNNIVMNTLLDEGLVVCAIKVPTD